MNASSPARRASSVLLAIVLLLALCTPRAARSDEDAPRAPGAAAAAIAPAAPSLHGARADASGTSHPLALTAILATNPRAEDSRCPCGASADSAHPAVSAHPGAGSRAPPIVA